MALAFVSGLLIVMALTIAPTPRSLQVTGYSGQLAEWSLTAALVRDASGSELSGPLTMEHTGLCSVDGPERKAGEMRLRLTRARLDARVLIDGVECAYNGTMSDVYNGMMACPGSRPVPLTLWVN